MPLDEGKFACGGQFQRVVLILVDSLGWRWLQRLPSLDSVCANAWQRLQAGGQLTPITSVVPSTTAAALTSLWTGRTPFEHGVVGYEVFLKEYGLIANMITQGAAAYPKDFNGLARAGFQPEAFLLVQTLGQHLSAQQTAVNVLQQQAITHSGLTRMLMQGARVIPYRTPSDLWVTLEETLEHETNRRSYTFAYWGDLDDLSHKFGPHDLRVALEFASFCQGMARFVERLRQRSQGDTLLVLTADHGQISTPQNDLFEVRKFPNFTKCLSMLPSGENRFAYLFPRPGSEQQLEIAVQENWQDRFALISAQQLLEKGWLGSGSMHPQLLDRIGDRVLIPQDDAYLWWANQENTLRGRHGGLTEDEMLVPLLHMVV
jgi:predicted AlkP superfamily pyrophosphatase or phosphodiesterase